MNHSEKMIAIPIEIEHANWEIVHKLTKQNMNFDEIKEYMKNIDKPEPIKGLFTKISPIKKKLDGN